MNAPCCPSDLALESLLLGRAAPETERHLDVCAPCATRVAEMRAVGDEFRRFVFPATVEKIEEAADRRRRWSRWWLALAPAPALAAAALLLIAFPSAPPDDYVGLKGSGGVGLSVFAAAADGRAEALSNGAAVAAGSALRFRLRTGGACRLVLVSVDSTGGAFRLDAGGADGFALGAGTHDLPGGAELDGRAGPERIFAVCAPEGVAPAAVEDAARRAAQGGAEAVRGASLLAGLPNDTPQASLLLEKRE